MSRYSLVTGRSVPGVKLPGREVHRSLPSSSDVKDGGAMPPLHVSLYDIALNYIIKYKGWLYRLQ